jgi:hypothetical protein
MGILFLFYFQEMSLSKLLACHRRVERVHQPWIRMSLCLLPLSAVLKEKLNSPREAPDSNPIFPLEGGCDLALLSDLVWITIEEMLKH